MEDLDARSRLILDAHFRGMALEFVVRRIVRDLEAVVPGITAHGQAARECATDTASIALRSAMVVSGNASRISGHADRGSLFL